MKLLVLVVTLVAFVGCATPIPYSSEERCANRGMVLAGVDVGSSSNVIQGPNNKIYYSSGDSETVRCEKPQSKEQEEEIKRILIAEKPKDDYNEGAGTRAVLTGLGYVLYVVPGFVMYLISSSAREEAINRSNFFRSELNRKPTAQDSTTATKSEK